ncbi:efflux RND transporter periplasmic adaptor subunit [Stieleria sp.]|uniref:efflux RND transporter periplasmic adaptor subunit n=1 Tax=Stieleria sp. TaxID=2795976 RepID=UPI0035632B5E
MMMKAGLQFVYRVLRPQLWSLTLCAATALICLITVYLIVWPAYQNPIARMYTSKLGYASIIRKSGGAFPVKSAAVERREIVGKFIGEGLVQSEPIQVPMIAMARILKVNVVEGQRVRKGDVIVELDRSRIEMKIQSARAALRTARSELDRVRLGTVNVLQEERSDILSLRSRAAEQKALVAQEVMKMHQSLAERNAMSTADFASSRLAAIRAELERQELEIAAQTASAGRQYSIKIGESAIREAELTLEHRLKELDDYVSRAPSDGIVERVLVHSGEYNQDPGRPAVLLASGLWFECYLDQTALGRVQVGDAVEVRLSAYQDRLFPGSIERIRPLVNFALGGPETNRPIRPLGTGAPEWPATFSVRVALEPSDDLVVPGLTGYATVIQKRNTLSVPRGTVTAVSGNRGIAFVVGDDGQTFQPRNVVMGIRDHGFVEIRDGLRPGETVITDGYQVLQPGDQIAIQGSDPGVRRSNGHPNDATADRIRLVGMNADAEPNAEPSNKPAEVGNDATPPRP